jgi:hypothetical protein
MAAHVYGEKRLTSAIQFLCEVMFLDLNGARNVGTINGRPTPPNPDYPDFDLSLAFPAPAVVSALVDLASEAGLNEHALGELFKTWTAKACGGLPVPLSISETWARLAELLPPLTEEDVK